MVSQLFRFEHQSESTLSELQVVLVSRMNSVAEQALERPSYLEVTYGYEFEAQHVATLNHQLRYKRTLYETLYEIAIASVLDLSPQAFFFRRQRNDFPSA